MATITTILGSDSPATSRVDINANFTALNVEVVAATSAVAGKEASGTAAAAVAAHVGLSDPHTQYALESDVTSALAGKAATSHTHAIADSTGLQAALDAKAPAASPTFTGPITSSGAVISAGTAMSGLQINVALRDNLYSATADVTWTHSATPAVGQEYGVIVTTDGTARTITLPVTAFSGNRGGDITNITFPASSTHKVLVRRTSGGYLIFGDPVTAAQVKAGLAIGISDVSSLQAALDAKAPLASPTFTGTPAVPTASPGTNTTQVASTAFVTAAVAAGGGGGSTGTFSFDDGDAAADPSGIAEFDDGDATTD